MEVFIGRRADHGLVRVGYSLYARDLAPEHRCEIGCQWQVARVSCACGYTEGLVAICRAAGTLPDALPCEHPGSEERERIARFNAAMASFPRMHYADVLPEYRHRIPYPAGRYERDWFPSLAWLTADCQDRLKAWCARYGRDVPPNFRPAWVNEATPGATGGEGDDDGDGTECPGRDRTRPIRLPRAGLGCLG